MRTRKGFTLIELLIVVLILGALAAIIVPRITASATTAKANACKTNIDIINSQIELYKAQEGDYPTTLTVITSDVNYFPDGAPVCPITGLGYPATLVDNRVDDSAHGH